jgi:tetratricopeptide (TPR) repeat protein
MILAGPSIQPALQAVTRSLADVAPTILVLFGKAAPAEWTGSTLMSSPSSSLAEYLETMHPQLFRGWSPLFGLRTDRWKYIRAPRPELYDLIQDPGETSNVIRDQPEVARELSTYLQKLLDAAPPPEVPQADEQTMEQLRSLGYVAAVEPGSIPEGGKDPKDGIESLVALFEGEEAYLDTDFARAEKYLLRALQLDPQSKEACSFLSGTYYSLRRYDLSAEYATRALGLVPHMNEAPLYMTRGEALLALGKKEEAAKSFRESLRIKPGDAKVEELLRRAENPVP